VTYPDIAQWVSTARVNFGRDRKLGQWLVQLRQCFKEDFVLCMSSPILTHQTLAF